MSGQDARQILVEWANEQQNWVRFIVRNVLATGSLQTEEEIIQAFGVCLAERGMSETPATEVPHLSFDAGNQIGIERLQLESLSEVGHVNRLAPNQEIIFNNRMTILFGENATGKSGYVRILKRLGAVRSSEEILPNIHDSAANDPTAMVKYSLGNTEQTIQWNGEAGVPPLTRIGIFDTSAMAFHVDDELTYVYTPRDLALFQYTHQAIQDVEAKFVTRRNEVAPSSNPFLRQFQVGSVIYPKIETLGAATDLLELEKLSAISEEELESLDALRQLVEALRPATISTRLQLARHDLEMYKSLAVIATATIEFDSAGYISALPIVDEAQQNHLNATVTAFEPYDISDAFTDTWQRFIAAAEDHLESTGRTNYPESHEKCIYCQQDLSTAALELVALYRSLSRGSTKSALDTAQANLRRIGQPVATLNVEQLYTLLLSKESVSSDAQTDDLIRPAIEFLESVRRVSSSVTSGQPIINEISISNAVPFRDRISQAVRIGTEFVQSLEKQGAERERESAMQASKLRDLEDRLLLKELFIQLKLHVESAQWGARANQIISSRFPPLLRSLTNQAKMASETLLNEDFERMFNEERIALRAPEVALQFPGRRGEAARRKSLTPDHRLSEILSEGEQKVIAIADFLAEVGIRSGSAPIVFDDPVNSLDYRRLNYIIDRLYRLSEDHQIIVFTHNIWFAAGLLEKFQGHSQDCTYYNVGGSDTNGVGLVDVATNPRWDSPGSLRGRLNSLIQDTRQLNGESRQAMVEQGYSLLRSWCEVFVEHEMLQGVTHRYRPNIMMTGLSKIRVEKLNETRESILEIFEKCCRMTEAHSQPLETLGVQPMLEELISDWETACDVRDAYIKA